MLPGVGTTDQGGRTMNRRLLAGLSGVLLLLALGAAAVEQITREEFDALATPVKAFAATLCVAGAGPASGPHF